MNSERIEIYRKFIRIGGTPNILPEFVEEVLAGVLPSERAAYISRALAR